MIKATGGQGDNKVVILGLSEENCRRMRQDKPIHVFGAEIGIPFDIVIFWGETEAHLAQQMQPFVRKDTIVHGDFSAPLKKS